MQDEITQKTIAFTVNTTKFNSGLLLKLAKYFLSKAKNLERDLKNPTIKHGKQSVKRLGKQGRGMENVEINSSNIKSFEKYARKYGVDFALKKDKSFVPPKYTIFFKGQDEKSIQNALRDYAKAMTKKKSKPSVIQKLRKIKDDIKSDIVTRKLAKALKKSMKRGAGGR